MIKNQSKYQKRFLNHSGLPNLIDVLPDKKGTEVLESYKTFVKTNYNKELSDYIKGLTGITERDVSSGESFNSVMEMLKQIVEEYEVKTIVVWGPDQMLLRHNCTLNGYEKKKMKKQKLQSLDLQ